MSSSAIYILDVKGKVKNTNIVSFGILNFIIIGPDFEKLSRGHRLGCNRKIHAFIDGERRGRFTDPYSPNS